MTYLTAPRPRWLYRLAAWSRKWRVARLGHVRCLCPVCRELGK